ncbi:MAG: response regulator transcription factor [Acidobacteria bacterium]|nr:response regulator transcription factor [Acidobacteriota bacterium]
MKAVWVVSTDWKLRALVRAELRERGYDAQGYESLASPAEADSTVYPPTLIVLDTIGMDPEDSFQLATAWAARVPVLVVLSGTVAPFPPTPNVQLLRRPLRIEEVVTRVCALAGAPG